MRRLQDGKRGDYLVNLLEALYHLLLQPGQVLLGFKILSFHHVLLHVQDRNNRHHLGEVDWDCRLVLGLRLVPVASCQLPAASWTSASEWWTSDCTSDWCRDSDWRWGSDRCQAPDRCRDSAPACAHILHLLRDLHPSSASFCAGPSTPSTSSSSACVPVPQVCNKNCRSS